MRNMDFSEAECKEVYALLDSAKAGINKLDYILTEEEIREYGQGRWTRNKVIENIRQIRVDLMRISNIVRDL